MLNEKCGTVGSFPLEKEWQVTGEKWRICKSKMFSLISFMLFLQITRLYTHSLVGFTALKRSRGIFLLWAGCSTACSQSHSGTDWNSHREISALKALVHVLHLLFCSVNVIVYPVCVSCILFNCWAKCGIPRRYSCRKKSFGTCYLNVIKKGWDIAVMIHKHHARTFHNGNQSPLYQKNRAIFFFF